MRRILAIGLAAAAVYAAVLGTAVPAQAPETTPEASPAATSSPAAITSPAPTAVATEPPAATPAATEEPTPFPSPVETTVGTPEPTATNTPGATPDATPEGTPEPAATPGENHGIDKPSRDRRARNRKSGGDADARTCEKSSTSDRGCDKPRKNADGDEKDDEDPKLAPRPRMNNADGSPAPTNPGYSLATPGPARIGVPNFFIDKFRIPPFLLPIYQAAGMEYGIRWEILAAINEIETDYGRNLNVSYAGALGWMQFMPATWEMYGTDANRDGEKDPYNPVDAIFAAARYLKAAGAATDIRRAIFAYNHANWYVDSVLMRAQVIGGLPSDLVGSLTGLTQGRFPVHARATYAGKLDSKGRKVREGNAAMVVESDATRRGIQIFSKSSAPVIAVQDGRIVKIGRSKRLGRFVVLQDVYGNTYTYAQLGSVPESYPAPKRRTARRERTEQGVADLKRPQRPASKTPRPGAGRKKAVKRVKHAAPAPKVAMPTKERLFAHPDRPNARAAGGALQLAEPGAPLKVSQAAPVGFDPRDFEPKPFVKGARVIGGTLLGRLKTKAPEAGRAHLLFEIRPAGRGAPRIDPKPILDGWKLLESTAVYRAAGKNPLMGADADRPTIGQILLMSKETLTRRVIADPRIQIYGCGESDIRSGQIDRRVLATLLYLAGSGLKPTVTSLKCGHSTYTSSGNISEHSLGSAVDIAVINGVVITPATQGPGSITDLTIQRLLTLQGTMKPHQIISLMTFAGADNTYAMGDHDDHIHVGWSPLYGQNRRAARKIDAILKPEQWIKLIDRLGSIDNPTVREQPSRFSVKVVRKASGRHKGE